MTDGPVDPHPELAPLRGPAHDLFRRMTLERFDALTLWGRPSDMRLASRCASAWSTRDEAVLAGVFHLFETKEFLCIAFVRDGAGRYRPFQRSPMFPSCRAGDLAIAHDLGAGFARAASETEPEPLPAGVDLFTPVPGVTRFHPAFEMLRDGFNQLSARQLLEHVAPWIGDRDGNLVRDFQTSGYSARVWELYLWVAFTALGFEIDPGCAVPDFRLSKQQQVLFVEATTANGPDPFLSAMAPGEPRLPEGDLAAFLEHEMPIIFGSPLFSKLQKRYWTQPHVAGHPFILAIADFHSPASMRWSHTALPFLLYGFGIDYGVDPAGGAYGIEKPLAEHIGRKTIPSNFFAQPETEHISAILSSNAGTIVKFSRMGLRAGFGDPWVSLVRKGVFNNPAGGLEGIPFNIDVESPEYEEGWADELRLYHNPNALHPVDEALFPGIAHIRVEGGERLIRTPATQVLRSQTVSHDFLHRTAGRPTDWDDRTKS